MKINLHNFRELVDRTIQNAEKAHADLIELYDFAVENAVQITSTWKEFSVEWFRGKVRRIFGLDPDIARGLAEQFGSGRKGFDLMSKFGAAEVQRAATTFGRKKDFETFKKQIPNLKTPEEFSKAIDLTEKKVREAGAKLSEEAFRKRRLAAEQARQRAEEEARRRAEEEAKQAGTKRTCKNCARMAARVTELEAENKAQRERVHELEKNHAIVAKLLGRLETAV